MYKRLPYFRNLVIKYNRYRRKIRRYESLHGQGRSGKSWIVKRINKLKLKIDQYLESASLAKKAALLSAGLLSFGLATGQSYELRSEHPFYKIVGNNSAAPTFVDYDGDGDHDLILFGEASDTLIANTEAIQYYENKESSFSPGSIPGFPADLGLATLIDTSFFGADLVPCFVDYDGDGDLDVFIGSDAELRYLRNEGGVYQPMVGAEDPFDAVEFASNVKPALGDIDGDGDIDAYIGGSDGLRLFSNEDGVMADQGMVMVDGPAFEASPLLFDLDDDGDLDLLVGNKYGDLFVFINDAGTMTQSIDHPLTTLKVPGYANLALVDMDGDGDIDVVAGESPGTLHVYLNENDVYSELAFNTLGVLSSSTTAGPEFVDFDGDGDLDLFIGLEEGGLQYYENQNGKLVAASIDAFAGLEDEISYSKPAFADYDGDGDLDLLVGSYNDPMVLYNNNAGTYTMVDSLDNPFFKLSEELYQVPEFVDLDNDGDLDLVIGTKYGALFYFANNDGKFEEVLDGPFTGIDPGSYATPAFVDLDFDGDMDLVVGTGSGTLVAYLNNDGVFAEQVGQDNPFNGFNFVRDAAPAFADLDGDNDLDVLVGNQPGGIFYLENVGGLVSTDDRLDVSSETLLFPNPAQSMVQIRTAWNNQDGLIEIFDNQGRMVQKIKFFGSETQLDLRHLSAGNYHVRISNTDKKATKSLFKL